MEIGGRKCLFIFVAAVAVAAIISRADAASPWLRKSSVASKAPRRAALREPVKVLEIVSGDSLLVLSKGRRMPVRLQGVNVPEKDDPRSEEAVKLLQDLLANKSVQMAFGFPREVKKDDRGRLIATLFADGESVNEQMIIAGWSAADNVVEPSPLEGSHHFERDAPEKNPEPLLTTRSSSPKSPKNVADHSPSTERVYIKSGDKTYHRARCRLLQNVRAIPILKSEAIRQGYKRCSRCKP